MRLTDNEFHTKENKERACCIQEPRLQQIYDKLFELEDIEEELGIDLITLFKAQTNGFYIKNYLGINKVKLSDFKFNLIKKEVHRIVYSEHYYFKDYGKTWALTKGELTNGK